ncbi:MAG: DinB family protein [Planctomycetaceae bacterium]|nr:DinB family protein [Planctomycetaceae bacterium]
MQVDLTPTLIDMYRETFEGEVKQGWCWIVSGPAEASVFASLDALTADQAYAEPKPGRKSIAGHAAHLRYTLDLTLKRLNGENPTPDWKTSFDTGAKSPAAWEQLKKDLRTAYDGVLAFFDSLREKPINKWIPIHAVGLSAMIGHNAYHLGAIRQLMLDVRD